MTARTRVRPHRGQDIAATAAKTGRGIARAVIVATTALVLLALLLVAIAVRVTAAACRRTATWRTSPHVAAAACLYVAALPAAALYAWF